jgi:hypothetical protein
MTQIEITIIALCFHLIFYISCSSLVFSSSAEERLFSDTFKSDSMRNVVSLAKSRHCDINKQTCRMHNFCRMECNASHLHHARTFPQSCREGCIVSKIRCDSLRYINPLMRRFRFSREFHIRCSILACSDDPSQVD